MNLIYTPLEFTVGTNGRAEIITTPFIRGMWDATTSELMTFFTSSLQTTASQEYYYEIWSSASLNCENKEKVFSVAYGHVSGSGSQYNNANVENTSGDTPSKSIYNQFKQMCLDGDEGGLKLSGSLIPMTHFYVVSINRDKFGDKMVFLIMTLLEVKLFQKV